MKVELEVELPTGFESTGEFRIVDKDLDTWLGLDGYAYGKDGITPFDYETVTGPRIILRKIINTVSIFIPDVCGLWHYDDEGKDFGLCAHTYCKSKFRYRREEIKYC